MKDLSYNHIFNGKISHRDSLKKMVKDHIVNIIMEENSISEKSFSKVDDIIKKVNGFFNGEMLDASEKMYSQNKRINYIAEFLYDTYIKQNSVNETIDSFSEFIKTNRK